MNGTGKYVLLNRDELDAYLRDIACKFANAAAAQPLVDSLGPVLAQRAENLRAATAEDLAKHDPELIEMQTQVLGRRFYMFDPALDAGLRDDVIKAAEVVRAMIDGQEALRNLGGSPDITPLYLRRDFLHAALSVPQPVYAAAPAPQPEQKLDAGAVREMMRASLADILKEANLGKMIQPDTEDSFKIAGGGKVIRYISFEKLEKDNEELGNALGAIDREQMQSAEYSYYGVIDESDRLRALIRTGKENTLFLNRCAPGRLPDPDTCDKVLAFARHKNLTLTANSACTGLVSTTRGLQNMFKLAEETELNYFTLVDYPADTPLKNVAVGARFFEDFHVEDCPEFTTLAGIGKIEGGLKIRNCPNFTDIGDITVAGCDPYYGFGVDFRGCTKLASLGKLQTVGGNLDIRGTAIRSLPDTLTHVGGRIYTDHGTFRWLRSARKALARAGKELPPPPLMLPGPYP
jgi:hypothetical protein